MTDSRHSSEMTDDEIFEDGPDADVEKEIDLDGGTDDDPAASKSEGRGKEPDPFDDDSDGQPPEEEEPEPKPEDGKAKEADGDEDDAEYSKKVQRRINKEVAKRKSIETRAERLERENRELRERLGQTQTQALDNSISGLEAKVSTLRGKVQDAIDSGDTQTQLDLQDQLDDAKYDLRRAREAREQAPRPAEPDSGDRQPRTMTPEQKREQMLRSLPQKSQDWIAARGFFDWSESQKAFAMGIDSELTAEGWSPDDDGYYAEMDKRISIAFPDLYDDGEDDTDTPAPQKRTKAANRSAPPSTAPGGRQTSGKVRLGPAEFKEMRRFGLDPDNAEHVAAFAREKLKSQSSQ